VLAGWLNIPDGTNSVKNEVLRRVAKINLGWCCSWLAKLWRLAGSMDASDCRYLTRDSNAGLPSSRIRRWRMLPRQSNAASLDLFLPLSGAITS